MIRLGGAAKETVVDPKQAPGHPCEAGCNLTQPGHPPS
jgi:hypothetical protein